MTAIGPVTGGQEFIQTLGEGDEFQGSGGAGSNGTVARCPTFQPDHDMYLMEMRITCMTVTTNDASNYWSLLAYKDGVNIGNVVTTAADTPTTWGSHLITVNALVGAYKTISLYVAKNGGPGNIIITSSIRYRLVS